MPFGRSVKLHAPSRGDQWFVRFGLLGLAWATGGLGEGVETVGGLVVEAVHELPVGSMVTMMEEWPRRVWMTLGYSPAVMSQEAWEWRRSCIRQGPPTDSATARRQILHRRCSFTRRGQACG